MTPYGEGDYFRMNKQKKGNKISTYERDKIKKTTIQTIQSFVWFERAHTFYFLLTCVSFDSIAVAGISVLVFVSHKFYMKTRGKQTFAHAMIYHLCNIGAMPSVKENENERASNRSFFGRLLKHAHIPENEACSLFKSLIKGRSHFPSIQYIVVTVKLKTNTSYLKTLISYYDL